MAENREKTTVEENTALLAGGCFIIVAAFGIALGSALVVAAWKWALS